MPAALAFRATTVDGTAFAGAELAGKKTVLWFWAPWCTVCARAAAGVKDAATALGPDVRVVGVAGLSTDAADMRRFVDRGGLQSMTNLADTTGDLYARFGDHPAGHLRADRAGRDGRAGIRPTARTSTSWPSLGRPSAERPWTPHHSCSLSAPAPSPR